jgi:regulator of nonsense transcripts 3
MATTQPTKKQGQANGVLPISASTIHHAPAAKDGSRRAAREQGPRLKVVIRRLPPGLTQAEFETAVGEQWKLGGERVDWMEYRAGKVSKE